MVGDYLSDGNVILNYGYNETHPMGWKYAIFEIVNVNKISIEKKNRYLKCSRLYYENKFPNSWGGV